MTTIYTRLAASLEHQLDAAYHAAAMAYTQAVRQQLAQYNLKRHIVLVQDECLRVSDMRTDRRYWELRRHEHPLIDAIFLAGEELDRLPKEVAVRLEGAVIL